MDKMFMKSLIQIHLMFLFIPISEFLCRISYAIQIHLMFLFIVSFAFNIGSIDKYSNTSHVLIYRLGILRMNKYSIIQIHLMFLFIGLFAWGNLLSNNIQIHLMFLFIPVEVITVGVVKQIQIHLMFLFIAFRTYV